MRLVPMLGACVLAAGVTVATAQTVPAPRIAFPGDLFMPGDALSRGRDPDASTSAPSR